MERNPPYLFEYTHKGDRYSFTLWAESWEDAELRLRAIKDNAELIGSDCHVAPNAPIGLV